MAALLSIALFPIGLVAVMQTQSVARKATANAELALLALTEQSASRERLALRTARGAAEALASFLPEIVDDPDVCSKVMSDFAARSERYSFVSYIPTTSITTCSSEGRILDWRDNAVVQERMTSQRAAVTVNANGQISRTSVIVIYTPVTDRSGAFDGFITISVPHTKLVGPDPEELRDSLVELVTFNEMGDVLTSLGPLADAATHLPANQALADLLSIERRATTLKDGRGIDRIYTIATIEPAEVYALGVWDSNSSLARQTRGDILTSFFPALMWLAGLAVALTAVHRLVTRHLQVLGRQMALFTAARRLPMDEPDANTPTEIRRIQRAFNRMTEALLRDEASLENAVREKSVLVKEIHHRVKNNLQLISSIINMQIRAATTPEEKRALRQTQDRVLSMATIHRDLYETNETGLVDVGHLVREVVGKTIEATPDIDDVKVTLNVDDIWLYPDQAVPMSMLSSEAVINALKHMPARCGDDVPRWLSVSLSQDEARLCTFRAENTADPGTAPGTLPRGMGRALIRAFATQLEAQVETDQTDDAYRLSVTFVASEFAPAPGTF